MSEPGPQLEPRFVRLQSQSSSDQKEFLPSLHHSDLPVSSCYSWVNQVLEWVQVSWPPDQRRREPVYGKWADGVSLMESLFSLLSISI